MQKFSFKRFTAWMLALAIVLSVVPVNAFAAGADDSLSGITASLLDLGNVMSDAGADGGTATAAETQSGETVLDAAIFCSDVHGTASDLASVLSGVKTSGVDYSSIGFVGDTCLTVANTTSTVQSALGDTDIDVMFSYAASHDTENGADISTNWNYSGEVEGVSDDYLVYTIRETDMQSASGASNAAHAFTTWYNGLTDAQQALPIFIMSHRPLHDRREDNAGAATWYDAISAAAETSDITFFWAHNHTGETDVDTAAYYVAKDGDETFTVYNGDTVTPNFTYMNAGYINANNQNPARIGVATTVQITADSMIFQDYNSSGEYTGSYAHNVTVAREFAETKTLTSIAVNGDTEYTVGNALALTVTATYSDGTTEDVTNDATFEPAELTASGTYTVTASYGDMTDTIDVKVSVYDEVTNDYGDLVIAVEAFSQGATALAVAWDDAAETALDAKELYTDFVVYDLALTNPGESTEYAMSLVDNMDTANLAVYHVADDGTLTLVPHTIENDCVVFTTSLTGTFAYGSVTVPEGYTLSAITLAGIPTDLFVGGSLDLTDAVITATYTKEGAEDFARVLTVYDYDETNFSGYNVNDAGAQTVVFTFEGVTATLGIHVWGDEFTTNGVTVHVGDGDYGVTNITVAASTNENVTTAIADVISGDNYAAYDIGLVLADDYEATGSNKTVTLPIPEGVTKPGVYYVSDDGETVTNMGATDNGDGTVTFTTTHFSTYVVGESTEITVPDPTTGTVNGATTSTTAYVLANSLTNGGKYLIVNINSTGSGYALLNNSGSVSAVAVEVKESNGNYYIELDNSSAVWTAVTNSSGYNLTNTLNNSTYYLEATGSTSKISIDNKDDNTKRYWNYTGDDLGYYGGNSTHYIYYSNGFVSAKNSGSEEVYIYQLQDVTTSADGTYSIAGTPAEITKVVVKGTTATLGSTLTFVPESGATTTTDTSATATYTVVDGGDPNGIISGISGNTVTFTGKYGKALVKVSYTVTVNGTDYTVDNYITITATEPYYAIDLHKANSVVNEVTDLTAWDEGTTYYTYDETTGTYTQVDTTTAPDSSVTYYYVTYTLGIEITETIAIKGIEAGDKYGVWAVVTSFDGTDEDGTDMGSVGDDIEWSSSDTSIATVDPVTGIITFTGKEGTVQITATYKNGNRPSDTITISVTQSQYSVPADGTTDFPEYPNEGAIRYDKTATAVGNFSETGIAQIELSMTGVPYSTGSEIDVVLMLDMTGSMTDDSMAAAEAAAKAFANQIIKNEDGTYNSNRISVQIFNKNGVTELWSLSAVTADTYSSLVTAIESASDNQASGGTPYSTALSGCKDILDAARTDGTGNNRQQFCVFVSDGTPTSYTDVDGGSDTTKKEYYSSAMQEDGITVYGVYTSAAAGSSSSGGGSVNDTEEGTAIMQNVASSDDKVYVVEDYTDTSALTGVFTDIAMDILQAATDITVEDKITDEYTMIFDIPTGSNDITGLDSQEFYIEFVKYTLDEEHERTDSGTSVTKLYLGTSNGTYYAASDASGTAYAAPVFAQTTIGDKGTMYYWTTDSSESASGISVTVSGTTYYFVPYGIKATDDNFDSTKWFNMTSGAYASGTVDSTTNMSANLVIATPYFVYNASTKMLYWTVDKLDTTEYALRYFLYLDNSATEVGVDGVELAAGTYPTNDHAYITYTNFRGNDCQQTFPVPQLTWNGAQVSYVFYLVNAAGQPINKSGQIVDFANATFVTDTYTTAVVWNKGTDGQIEGDANLSVDWLAETLLPSEYLLYDLNAGYELKVYADATGESIFDYFTIEGNTAVGISTSLNDRLSLSTTASTVSVETTKVYNTKAGTKYDDYGTYTSKATDSIDNETVLTGFDFSNSTVAFAVVWQPKLVPDTVVVDYGLDVLINVVQNDLMQNKVSGIGLGKEAYGSTAMNTGVVEESKLGTAALTIDGNTISIENENEIRFHQGDMQFSEAVVFYYESPVKFYEGSEQKIGYMYSSVTVIPATTIYYEETFLTFTNTDGTRWTSESTATGNGYWQEVTDDEKYESNVTQSQDRPGESQISSDIDADNVYGYDPAYNNYTTYSLGAAKKVTVNAATGAKSTAPTVSFSFTGRGFDLVSLTDDSSGLIVVTVKDKDGNTVKSLIVDNYYGYAYKTANVVSYAELTVGDGTYTVNDVTYVNEGDVVSYNGITCPIGSITANDETTYYVLVPEAAVNANVTTVQFWKAIDRADESDTIYQVPVIKVEGLAYGEYTVTVQVAYMSAMDHLDAGEYSFWMDAVRIYDPANNEATDGTIKNAYLADDEAYPVYNEIGDMLIAADDLDVTDTKGVVFIDGRASVVSVADYANPGPNNEVYLAKGQGIAFQLTSNKQPTSTQIGAKLAYGASASLVYNSVVETDDTYSIVRTETLDLATATDMYYAVELEWTETNDGWISEIVVLSNNSTDETAVLSLTNIKNTFAETDATVGAYIAGTTGDNGDTSGAAGAGVYVLRRMYAAPEVFVPETFEAKVTRSLMGTYETLTVTTSEDVESITINGEELTSYRSYRGNRIWTKTVKASSAGTYEIVAYNADGLASEAITAAYGATGTGLGDALQSIWNGLDSLFGVSDVLEAETTGEWADAMYSVMEKLAARVFRPERFQLDYNTTAQGEEMLVVNTSEDVDYIISDGEIINNYITETIIDLSNDGAETVNRVWLVPDADESAEVAAYNNEGVASETASVVSE